MICLVFDVFMWLSGAVEADGGSDETDRTANGVRSESEAAAGNSKNFTCLHVVFLCRDVMVMTVVSVAGGGASGSAAAL